MDIKKISKENIYTLINMNAFTWSGWGMDIDTVKSHIEEIVLENNLKATTIYWASGEEIVKLNSDYNSILHEPDYFYAMIDVPGVPELYLATCGYGIKEYLEGTKN